jgi:hypothetical protein
MMAAWNYLIELIAGDIIELYWASADINMSIINGTAQTSPFAHPAVQSTILSITQQSGIMAGTGMTALNTLTSSVQTISTGTTGSDFNVASSGTVHTFNLPTASATNRGALSTTDWSTFNGKEPSITAGTTAQYYRGDKTFQTLNKSAVGLGNVDNTSDANKPVSTATSTALGLKQDTLVSGTNIKTVNGSSLLGSGNISVNSGVSLIAKKTMVTQTGSGAIVLIASEDISSYIVSNSMIQVTAMYRKTVGTLNYTPRLYVNTSATLVGATLIATFGSIAALNLIMDNIANFAIDASGNLYSPSPTGSLNTRYLNTLAGSVITIPSPCFLIWAGQLTNSADAVVMLNSNVIKYA